MPKKSTRKTLVKKLDTITSLIVRKRDGKCVVCGSRENLTCGHLFSRINYSTRWDLKNCHAQCWGCNYKHEFEWEPYRKWFVDTYGQEEYDNLYRQHVSIRKWKDYELEALLAEYKQLYETL